MEAATLAQEHLNDPNYDVEDNLRRSSKERIGANASGVSSHPSAAIRRRVNAGPPSPLSPPTATTTTQAAPAGTFPLISNIHNIHQFHPQSAYTHSTNVHDSQDTYGPPTPSSSQAQSSSVDMPQVPRITVETTKSIDTDEYDLESIAQSASSRRLSRDSYGYEKKGASRSSGDEIEMETRSDIEFEECVLSLQAPAILQSVPIGYTPSYTICTVSYHYSHLDALHERLCSCSRLFIAI